MTPSPVELAFRLPIHPAAPTMARHLMADVAHVRPHDEVALVTSELVANAVEHARSLIRVCFRFAERGVRVEVFDDGDDAPTVRRHQGGLGPARGRGLLIVDALAKVWGCSPEPGGKTVWAELDLEATPLPVALLMAS